MIISPALTISSVVYLGLPIRNILLGIGYVPINCRSVCKCATYNHDAGMTGKMSARSLNQRDFLSQKDRSDNLCRDCAWLSTSLVKNCAVLGNGPKAAPQEALKSSGIPPKLIERTTEITSVVLFKS